jgi:hypothetical protein
VRGRNVTRAGKRSGVVDLDGLVASWGQETSGECAFGGFAGAGISGDTLKWDPSLRKVTRPARAGASVSKTARWIELKPRGGSVQPIRR